MCVGLMCVCLGYECVCVWAMSVCVFGLWVCVCLGYECVCVCVCVCFSLAVPQEMTRWNESCSNNCTFGFFSKNEAEFFGWATNAKLGKYKINFGVVVVSDICIFWALCEEVQLRLCHSQHAVRAESVLTREPGLSAPARLYGQTVHCVCVCVCACVCAGPSLRPDCVHWVCTLSMFSWVSHHSRCSGSLPWCILDLGLNNIPVCAGF